jgi:ADP-ribosylglycohydrolase
MRRRVAGRTSHAETLAAIDEATGLSTTADLDGAIRSLGEGWVGEEALAIALYAARRAGDFKDAMRICANHDGDSDSTASIAGQIRGAEHGLTGVPNAWVRRLDVFDPLCEVAGELLRIDGTVMGV